MTGTNREEEPDDVRGIRIGSSHVPFTPRSFHSRVVHWRKVNGTDEGRVTETDEM